jgi:hypothetical protein
MNGFQTGAWAQILDKCNHLGAGNTEKCPLFNITSQSMQAVDACKYTQAIPDEDVGLVDSIPQLPGCISVGGGVVPSCPQVAFAPATAFVTTSLRQKAGLPIISSDLSNISSTTTPSPSTSQIPSPTTSQNAGTTSSASPSAITVVALISSKPPQIIPIVVGVICGVVALVIFSAILWFFWRKRRQRDLAAHSATLVGSSRSNGDGNFTDYSTDKDIQRQYGGVFKPFRPAELPSPTPISLDFKNNVFELPTVSPTTLENSSSKWSQRHQENDYELGHISRQCGQ